MTYDNEDDNLKRQCWWLLHKSFQDKVYNFIDWNICSKDEQRKTVTVITFPTWHRSSQHGTGRIKLKLTSQCFRE